MTLHERLSEYIAACFTGLWVQSHEHDDALREIAQMCREHQWRLAVWDIDRGLQMHSQGNGTELVVDDGLGGVSIEYTDRDFLVRAEDFVLDGRPAEPMRGDRIEEFIDRGTFLYEVLATTGHSAWRYDDPYRQIIRIHTKLIRR